MNESNESLLELQEYHVDTAFGGEVVLGSVCFDPQCNEPHYMIKRVGEVFAELPATPVS